jgi:rhomboid protease GluP
MTESGPPREGEFAAGAEGAPDLDERVRAYRAAQAEVMRAREFFGRLHALVPRPWATWTLIGINVAVFVVMVASGVSATSPDGYDIFRWGGDFRPDTEDQPWRLLTACFVHVGAFHLLLNMYCLWILGPIAERAVGHSGYVATHLLSGVAGSLASHGFGAQAVGAGASGSVFGLLGLLLAYAVRLPRGTLPPDARKAMLRTGLFNVAINLVVGLSLPMVNNAAHMGGLVGGFLVGLLISRPPTDVDVARRPRRAAVALVVGSVVLAIAAGAMWSTGWRSPWPSYETRRSRD